MRVWMGSVALALVLSSASAKAQTRAEERQRSELLLRATQARSQGRWSEVVRLLRQVVELRATASVRLGLAGAYHELGQHSEAASQSALCMQTAPADRDLRDDQRTALVDTCGQVLREATARLATVTVETVPDGVQGASLRVDGEAVEGFAPGRPFYLAPGRRRFRLEAAGREAVEHNETLQAGATPTVRLQMGAAAGGGFLVGTGVGAPPGAGQSGESLSVAPWVLGGLGLAAVGVGVGFRVYAELIIAEESRRCASPCTQVRDRIDINENLGATFIVLGGVATGVSLVWLLARGSSSPRRSSSLTPSLNGLTILF
jgi:hypothetical protein